MIKKIGKILAISVIAFIFMGHENNVFAGSCENPVSITGVNTTVPSYPDTESHTIVVNLNSGNFSNSAEHTLYIKRGTITSAISPKFIISHNFEECNEHGCITVQNKKVTWTIKREKSLTYSYITPNTMNVYLKVPFDFDCKIGNYKIAKGNDYMPGEGCSMKISQERGDQICYQNSAQNACFKYGQGNQIRVQVSGLKNLSGEPWDRLIRLQVKDYEDDFPITPVNGVANFIFSPDNNASDHTVTVQGLTGTLSSSYKDFPGCSAKINTQKECDEDQCEEEQTIDPTTIGPDEFSLCKQINKESQPDQYAKCLACTEGTEKNEENAGVWTAIGCIKRDPVAIIEKLVTVGLGIGGGFALITFLTAGFIYSTSQGSPEKVKNAKEMMTAAIVGIVFVIFSVTMLQFIGWSVLKIPGFGG